MAVEVRPDRREHQIGEQRRVALGQQVAQQDHGVQVERLVRPAAEAGAIRVGERVEVAVAGELIEERVEEGTQALARRGAGAEGGVPRRIIP